ncbi:uncharacterized protein LOC122252252 isoform X2 [Penaeus japonicus]|uniref:uncharacterized protein LOC122252252 isoform X2 n=1 Tax=Penaeus japonicus TaxID=27405 RepID=UPI001C715EC6|nr:uncharacterized protein LOC122252252 isoform X2 [Penaeus japonicus]
MSVGHLCKTCGEGRVRPFQCSLDQAVVRCDNADCDSYLETPPWECVIRQTITPRKQRQSVFSGNQHYRAWSCSSSGALSDFRSPVDSPAEPCSSRTIIPHNLLPQETQTSSSVISHTSHTSITEEDRWNTSSSDSFFNLLCDLDLESTPTKARNEATSAAPQGNSLDLDVTAELESWMETFNCDTSVSSSKPVGKDEDHSLVKGQDQTLFSGQESFISQTLSELFFENQSDNSDLPEQQRSNLCMESDQRPYPHSSSGDRYGHVKEDRALCDKQFMSPAASAASDDSGFNDEEANKIKSVALPAVEEENFEYLLRDHLETPKDKAVRANLSCMSYNFEDLLCEENKGPAPADVLNFDVHPVMVTVEKCGNVDEVEPQRGMDTSSTVVRNQDTGSSDKPSRAVTNELHEDLNCFETTSVKDCGASDSCSSERGCHTIQSVPDSLSSVIEIDVEANAVQPSANTLESENVNSDISSQNITVLTTDAIEDVSENCTSELTTDGLSPDFDISDEQNCVGGKQNRGKHRGRGRGRGRGRSRVTNISQENQKSEETDERQNEVKAEEDFVPSSSGEGRGKGSYRGRRRGARKSKVNLKPVPRQTRQRTGTIEVQAPRTTKRTLVDVSSDDIGSSSLRSGLSSLLQGANQYVHDGRRRGTHNITNLSFRSLLKNPVAEDPWSVPEWHLEGLDIEIIVQSSRSRSPKVDSNEGPGAENVKEAEDLASKSSTDGEKDIERGNGKSPSGVSECCAGTVGDAEEDQEMRENVQEVSVPDDGKIVIDGEDSAVGPRNQSDYSSDEKQKIDTTEKCKGISSPTSSGNSSLSGSSVNTSDETKVPRLLCGNDESKPDSCKSHAATKSTISLVLSSSNFQNSDPIVCTSLQKDVSEETLPVSDISKKIHSSLNEHEQCKIHSVEELGSEAFNISNRVLVDITSGADKVIDNSDILSKDKDESSSSISLCSEDPTTSSNVSVDMNESIKKIESLNITIFPHTVSKTLEEKKNEETSNICETSDNNQDAKKTDICDTYGTDNAENCNMQIDTCSDQFEDLENLLRSCNANVQVSSISERTKSEKEYKQVDSDFPRTKESISTFFLENFLGSTNNNSNLRSQEAQDIPTNMHIESAVPKHQIISEVKANRSLLDELGYGKVSPCDNKAQSEEPNSTPPTVENSPIASPHYFMVLPDDGEVRTCIGFNEETDHNGQSNRNEAEMSKPERTEKIEDPKALPKESPSTYFSTLLKDLNFDETFFQCPVKEHPESTFAEHLSSSLFFGETADSSPLHPLQSASCHLKKQEDSTKKSAGENEESEMTSISECLSKDLQYSVESKQSVSKNLAIASLLTNNNAITKESVSETLAVSPLFTCRDPTFSEKQNAKESCSELTNEDLDIFGGGELHSLKRKGDSSDGKVAKLPSNLESKEENTLLDPNTRSSNKTKLFEIVQHSSASSLSASSMKASTFPAAGEKLCTTRNSKPVVVTNKRKLSETELEDTNKCVKRSNQASSAEGLSFRKKDGLTVIKTVEKISIDEDDDDDLPIVSLDDDDDIQIIVPEKKIKVKEEDISLQCYTIKKENEDENSSVANDFECSFQTDNDVNESDAECMVKSEISPKRESLFSNTCDMLPVNIETPQKTSSEPVEESFFTCGILDNSIPHDKKCYSPRMKVFVDFEDSFKDGEPPSTLKVYYGTKKSNYEICKDLNVAFNLSESAHQNSDELTVSVLSPSHVSHTDTFTYNPGFGCTKFSPQHNETDSARDKRVSDLGIHDFGDFLHFLSDSPSSEGSMSPTESRCDSMEYFGNSAICKGDTDQVNIEPKAENDTCKDSENNSSVNSEFHMQNNPRVESTSKESLSTHSSTSEQISRTLPIHTLTKIPETELESRSEDDALRETSSKRDARVLILPRNNSCDIPVVPAVPIKNAIGNHLQVTRLGVSTASSGTSLNTLNPPSTSAALNPSTHSILGQTQAGHVQQILRPPLHHTHIQGPGNLVNLEPSELPRIPVSQVYDCTNNSSSFCSPNILGMANRNPNIDYKMPQQTTRPIIVPPALASSYKNDFLQDRETPILSNGQSSERIIAVTRQTSAGPVTRLLRVSTLDNGDSDASQAKSSVGDSSGSELGNEKPPTTTHCDSEEKKEDLLSNNMIKKVKMGSKGSFYLRPSPALMNAIAELRSKGNLASGNKSKLDRSDIIELPDGAPISHPIHIQSKVALQRKSKRKRRFRRDYHLHKLVKEKVQETMERRKMEEVIPEMVAVCVGGKLHIYHRKDVH